MKVLVDEMPKTPKECLFSKFNCEYGYICCIKQGRCQHSFNCKVLKVRSD